MRTRGLLVPGIVFALIIARLLQLYQSRATTFVTELAIYTCLGALLLVYRLCGKRKPWLVVGGVMLAELGVLAVLLAPASLVFCTATGIEGPEAPDGLMRSSSFFVRWYAHAVCAGLREELLKMAPVFGLAFLTARAGRVKSSRWGVAEPLDAILYACAAATTFILVETLMQYVPGARKDEAAVALSVIGNQGAAELYGELRAGQLAVIRTLDSLTGHLAYSGYFGYYVGLALMRPAHRHKLVLGGWVAASLVHGFFNASGGPLLRAVATVLAMLLLIAAILNARKLSPTRGDNFATVSLDHVRP